MNHDVELRDTPMDPLSERDQFAQRVLNRLRERDDVTAYRFSTGHLSPKEIARVAAEVHLEEKN